MRILDFHTHAFPDELAERAITVLTDRAQGVCPETDGTVSGLRALMDRCGVEKAVLASIATKPAQSRSILEWSLQVASDRLIPFGSVHPDAPDCEADIENILKAGLKGIKIHPLYQDFAADDPRAFPMYDAIEQTGLPLLTHAGYDIAFGGEDLASPHRFLKVFKNFPRLRLILAHFGGWKMADVFLETLAGKDVFIDTSFAAGYCSPLQRDAILRRHDTRRILFASDSPWGGMEQQIRFVQELPLPDEAKEKIFHDTAVSLLELHL